MEIVSTKCIIIQVEQSIIIFITSMHKSKIHSTSTPSGNPDSGTMLKKMIESQSLRKTEIKKMLRKLKPNQVIYLVMHLKMNESRSKRSDIASNVHGDAAIVLTSGVPAIDAPAIDAPACY